VKKTEHRGPGNHTDDSLNSKPNGPRMRFGRGIGTFGIPSRWALVHGGILLALAFGSALLVQRGETRAETVGQSGRTQALEDLLTRAVRSDIALSDTSRLLPILESAVRLGNLDAGAVIDASGVIIAHTDVARVGGNVDMPPAPDEMSPSARDAFSEQVFGEKAGKVSLRPLLDADGSHGMLVLSFPRIAAAPFFAGLMRYLLPAGLLLLALAGLSRAAFRSMTRPADALIERITTTLESKNESQYLKMPSRRESDRLIAEAVRRVDALTEAKEDLTFRNRLLGYEKKRMELILDCLPDGLVVTDDLDKIVSMNTTARRILVVSGESNDGRTVREIPSILTDAIQATGKTGQAVFAAPNPGGERQILLYRVPMVVSEDRAAGVLYVLRDITAHQSTQRAQAEFLSQVSHELKAPLNMILTYVETLADEETISPEDRRQFYNTLMTETERMAQLITNLLQLSRIELGDLSARCGFVKPDRLFREQCESLRAHAAAQELALDVRIADNLPPVRGDKDLLGVAITNVLSNAIKYTPSGGKICVRASVLNGGVNVEVEDSGIGIPEEIRSLVFQRFFRSDQDEVREKNGTGLGLAIVKEIIDAHDGQIVLESAVGKGSCFRIWLPSLEAGTQIELRAA
jgi:signal transduction histidine kinase